MNHKLLPAMLVAAGIATPEQAERLADVMAEQDARLYAYPVAQCRAGYVVDPAQLPVPPSSTEGKHP